MTYHTKLNPLAVLLVFILLCITMLLHSSQGSTLRVELTETKVNVIMETTQGTIELELWLDLAPKTVQNFIDLSESGFFDGIYFHRVIPNFMIQSGCPNTKDGDRGNDGRGNPGYRFEDECYLEGTEITGVIPDEEVAALVYEKILIPYLQINQQNSDPEIIAVLNACQDAQSWAPFMKRTIEFYQDKTGSQEKIRPRHLKASVDYGYIAMANSGPNTNGSQFFIVTNRAGAPHLNGKHTVFGKVTKGMDIAHKIENLPRDANDNPLPENQAVITRITIGNL